MNWGFDESDSAALMLVDYLCVVPWSLPSDDRSARATASKREHRGSRTVIVTGHKSTRRERGERGDGQGKPKIALGLNSTETAVASTHDILLAYNVSNPQKAIVACLPRAFQSRGAA